MYPRQFFIVLLILKVLGGVQAGNLEPSDPPGPTMKPLDQIEPRKALIPGPVPIGADYRVLIQEPGSYYLTGDLVINFRHAIKITASNVTLDMNGFRLYSSWAPPTFENQDFDGISIAGGCENIEIRDGLIVSDTAEGRKGFRYGIYADSTTSQIRLSNLKVIGSRLQGVWLGGVGTLVDRCTVWRNGSGIAVNLESTVQFCRVSENTTNLIANIYGIYGESHNKIIGNLVFRNGTDASTAYGIFAGDGSLVKENVVCENGESTAGFARGIYANRGSVVADCTVAGNGLAAHDSLGICVNKGCSVIGCAVYDNGYSSYSTSGGIYAMEGCTLKNNAVYRNGWGCSISVGIYAPFYCLLDGNAVFEHLDNIFADASCVLGLNLNP